MAEDYGRGSEVCDVVGCDTDGLAIGGYWGGQGGGYEGECAEKEGL